MARRSFLQLEDGEYLLLEDGGRIIIDEAPPRPPAPGFLGLFVRPKQVLERDEEEVLLMILLGDD